MVTHHLLLFDWPDVKKDHSVAMCDRIWAAAKKDMMFRRNMLRPSPKGTEYTKSKTQNITVRIHDTFYNARHKVQNVGIIIIIVITIIIIIYRNPVVTQWQ